MPLPLGIFMAMPWQSVPWQFVAGQSKSIAVPWNCAMVAVPWKPVKVRKSPREPNEMPWAAMTDSSAMGYRRGNPWHPWQCHRALPWPTIVVCQDSAIKCIVCQWKSNETHEDGRHKSYQVLGKKWPSRPQGARTRLRSCLMGIISKA